MSQIASTSHQSSHNESSSTIIKLKKNDFSSFVFLKCVVSNEKLTEIALVALTPPDLTKKYTNDGDSSSASSRYKDVLVLKFDLQDQDCIKSKVEQGEQQQVKKMLSDENAITIINQFLKLQSTPICIFSHDRAARDYRILNDAAKELNVSLIDDLYNADTVDLYLAFDESRNADYSENFWDLAYRRHVAELPAGVKYDGKSCLLRLIQVLKKLPTEFWNSIPCESVVSHEPPLQDSQGLSCPMKKMKFCEDPGSRNQVQYDDDDETSNIKTFIFFDLETTGLQPHSDYIVELCAYAMNKDQLKHIDKDSIDKHSDVVPGSTDQINLMILPRKFISEKASQIHGITIEGLKSREKQIFSIDTAKLLESFIERQKQPVCFIAHNGFKFDFPMLHCHLHRSMTTDPLWKNIFCADSLIVHKKMFPGDKFHALSRIFENLLGGADAQLPASHSAEGDVLRLIMITRLCRNMLDQLERYKKLFDGLKPKSKC